MSDRLNLLIRYRQVPDLVLQAAGFPVSGEIKADTEMIVLCFVFVYNMNTVLKHVYY